MTAIKVEVDPIDDGLGDELDIPLGQAVGDDEPISLS
jgi:hypothetical protein